MFDEFTSLQKTWNKCRIFLWIRWSTSRFSLGDKFFAVSSSRILLKSRIAGSDHWFGRNMICCHGIGLGSTYTRLHELCWDAPVYSTVYHLFQHKMDKTETNKQTNKEYTQNHNELLANRSIYQKEEKRKFQLSSSLMGLLWDNEPIIQTEHNMVKNPNGRRRTRSLFISVSTDPLFSL